MKETALVEVLMGGDAMAYAKAKAVDRHAMQERPEHDVEAFVRRHREHVFRLAILMMAEREEAEDLTQDVLLRAFASRGKLMGLSDPKAWLRRVLVRRAYSRLKARKHVVTLTEECSKVDGVESQVEVRQVLASLSADQQIVLGLAMGEGLSYAEIAEVLRIPEGTVASRISAAKAAFRKAWEGQL